MSFLDSAESFLGMGDTPSDVKQVVAPELSGIGEVDTAYGIAPASEASGLGKSAPGSQFLPDWAGKALEPIMQGIMGAALHPNIGRAPALPAAAGHGVTANTSGYDSLLKQASHLGENDPLQGLSGFKNLL
ncbi:hypothetical protein GVT67_11790 [Salmonella enterica]|nr:hypothetical protein [Salmonella enterica]